MTQPIKVHPRWTRHAAEGLIWTRDQLKREEYFEQSCDVDSDKLHNIHSYMKCGTPCCIGGWLRVYAVSRGQFKYTTTKMVLEDFYDFTWDEANGLYTSDASGWKAPFNTRYKNSVHGHTTTKRNTIARAYLKSIITTGKVIDE